MADIRIIPIDGTCAMTGSPGLITMIRISTTTGIIIVTGIIIIIVITGTGTDTGTIPLRREAALPVLVRIKKHPDGDH